MRSGCLSGQDGARTPTPKDNSIQYAPMSDLAEGVQVNGGTSTEHRVVSHPAEIRKGHSKLQQQSQKVDYKEESQENMECTGLQHRKPKDHACARLSSDSQRNKAKNGLNSVAHDVEQDNSHFVIASTQNPARQSAYDSDQGKSDTESFKREILKDSDLNKNTEFKRRWDFNSPDSFAGPQEDGSGGLYTKQCKHYPSEGNSSDPKSFFCSSVDNFYGNISTSSYISNESGLHLKSSQSCQNSDLIQAQTVKPSGGTHYAPPHRKVSHLLPHCQQSADKDKLHTINEICEMVAEKVANYRSTLSNGSVLPEKMFPNNTGSLLQADGYTPQSNRTEFPPTMTPCFKEDVRQLSRCVAMLKQRTTGAGEPGEENSLKIRKASSELTATPKDRGDSSTSKRRSTEHPQMSQDVAGFCTKNEDQGPVTRTNMSGMTWDQMATAYPSSKLNCSSYPEQSPGFDVGKNLDNSSHRSGKDDTDQRASELLLTHAVACKTGSVTESTHLSNASNQTCQLTMEKRSRLCSYPDVPHIRSMAYEMLHVEHFKDPQYEEISDAEDLLEEATEVPNQELQNEPDDIWEVIPISILNLTFEEADDGSKENSGPQDDGKNGDRARHGETELRGPAYSLVPASAFFPVEVFDTPAQQEQAAALPSSCIHRQDESDSLENRKELFCDTDDSCDYSPDPEGNFLTVSKHFYRSDPVQPATCDLSP